MDFLEILKDATIDTLKLIPLLLVVYFLIEFLEYKNVFKFEKSKLLTGKASPVIGALFGAVPQCGFSVVSSELYSKKKISAAALISVFIATSDEAIPILFSHISNKNCLISLVMLIITKIIMAILIGYFAMFLQKLIFKNNKEVIAQNALVTKQSKNTRTNKQNAPPESETDDHIHACCHHDLEDQKFDWIHPLVHSAKIIAYIFVINLLMGTIVGLVTEEKITAFLQTSYAFQPLVALLVGLIPNCVSSVVLTELYLMGGLSFGAIITGLSVNAGIGFLILFKENKNLKENLFILFTVIICSLAIGYILSFLPLNFMF